METQNDQNNSGNIIPFEGQKSTPNQENFKWYEIIVNEELVIDPNFTNGKTDKVLNFTEFFPLKFSTVESSKFEKLTPSARLFLIFTIKEVYRHCSLTVCVHVDDLPSTRGPLPEKLFSELSDFNYLRASKIKEKKEIKRKKGDSGEHQKVDDFYRILNSTQVQNISLTKVELFEQVSELLKKEAVFGENIPAIVKKNFMKFTATIVEAYGDRDAFRDDLNYILNEQRVNELSGAPRAIYVATRIENQALKVYNAGL